MSDVLILSEPVSYDELMRASTPAPATGSGTAVKSHRRPSSSMRKRGRPHPTKTIQVYHHRVGMAVLCFRERAYCLTNGSKAHVRENDARYSKSLMDQLMDMHITHLFLTDEASQVNWELVVETMDKDHPLRRLKIENLRQKCGNCPICKMNCVRYVAWSGLNAIRKVPADMIPHNQ